MRIAEMVWTVVCLALFATLLAALAVLSLNALAVLGGIATVALRSAGVA